MLIDLVVSLEKKLIDLVVNDFFRVRTG